jgi:hypothetical protein
MTDEILEVLKPGDQVVIKGHHIHIEGIRCWISEFKARVVKDLGLDKKNRHAVEVQNLHGQRVIERQFIKIDKPEPIHLKKEIVYVDIKCTDCGGLRSVRQCDAKQITRCELCQKANSKTKAKERYKERKKEANEVEG